MFKIQDGRKSFTQWDLNRKIIVEDDSITQVHFTNSNRIGENALVCEVIDNVVNVPNIILQGYGTIFVYGCDSNYTKYIEAFDIIRREKPDNYIYTETEVLNYNNLLERINSVEGSIEQVVADYLRENPPQVDLSGYATKEYVDNAIAAITAVDLSNYYTKAETEALIPDVSRFITGSEADTKISTAVSLAEERVDFKLGSYALKTEIPDVSGFQTETQVNTLISNAISAIGAAEGGTY